MGAGVVVIVVVVVVVVVGFLVVVVVFALGSHVTVGSGFSEGNIRIIL